MTSELMPNLPDRVCIWDADNNDPTSTRGWTTSFSEGHQNIYVRANENTRTVPDVPELVRLSLVRGGGLDYDDNGEYVRHDQAAAVIAAKDAEIKKQHDGGHESFKIAIGWQERALAAEAKLAQIEKQPSVFPTPVASDAELRAAAIMAEEYISKYSFDYDGRSPHPQIVIEKLRSALNPSEPKS